MTAALLGVVTPHAAVAQDEGADKSKDRDGQAVVQLASPEQGAEAAKAPNQPDAEGAREKLKGQLERAKDRTEAAQEQTKAAAEKRVQGPTAQRRRPAQRRSVRRAPKQTSRRNRTAVRRSVPAARRGPTGQTARQPSGSLRARVAPARIASEGRVARRDRSPRPSAGQASGEDIRPDRPVGSPVIRTVRDIAEVVPNWIWAVLAGLVALLGLLACSHRFATLRARRLAGQRREILRDMGVLQEALLPTVPERIGAARATAAYRPADGPAAGGDFYDIVTLPEDRTAVVIGDVSGHGRDALANTAFLRFTLRAHLEAGLEPRQALQTAAASADGQLRDRFATVLLAVLDPRAGSLTYAAAGHPPPLIVGPSPAQPVTVAASPPLGMGLPTGLRQTTLPLVPGSIVCLFTDGVVDVRTTDGRLGDEGLAAVVSALGDEVNASALLDRVAADAREIRDDMAACVLAPTWKLAPAALRTEVLELSRAELRGDLCRHFLSACGAPAPVVQAVQADARRVAARFDRAVLRVTLGTHVSAEALRPGGGDTQSARRERRSELARAST